MMSSRRLHEVLVRPHVSEKTAMSAEMEGRHAFRVARDATKPEVREAVERLFDVQVLGVQIVNVRGKAKRFGRTTGRRTGWRKAIVRLAEGQDLDFTGMES